MATFIASVAERNRQKRQMADQAVKLAMQNQWQEAIDVNRQIIELIPDGAEAWNRTGKALSELARYREAHEAYSEALKRDPNNGIALKQLKRLALLVDSDHSGGERSDKLDPKLLIEETGKTGIFELEKVAPPAMLARMAAGDQVHLHVTGHQIAVQDKGGQVLGMLPPRVSLRLIELMAGGNKYVAGVTGVDERSIRVLIREMYQTADLTGRVSFPSKGGPLPPEMRAYTKDRALRFDVDDDELQADGDDDDSGDGDAETEETTADIEYYEDDSSNRQ